MKSGLLHTEAVANGWIGISSVPLSAVRPVLLCFTENAGLPNTVADKGNSFEELTCTNAGLSVFCSGSVTVELLLDPYGFTSETLTLRPTSSRGIVTCILPSAN